MLPTNLFMANVDAAFVRRILSKSNAFIDHDGQTDELGDRHEVANDASFCLPVTLAVPPARLDRKAASLGRLRVLS